MSSVAVIDASAVLAYLQLERGQEVVEAALDAGPVWITTVNYCEVLSKLCEKGMPPDEARAAVNDLGMVIVDFDRELAWRAATLRVRTKPIGASLGDRACLALAERAAESQADLAVYTSERLWSRLDWPFKIVHIRPGKAAT